MSDIFGKEDEYIICKADYLEIYILEELFEKGLAEDGNQVVKTFGVLPVGLFKGGKRTEIRTLAIPYKIEFLVHEKIKEEVSDLYGDETNSPCLVLHYYKGQRIMQDGIVENADNVEMYLKLLMSSRIPKTTKYDDIFTLWLESCRVNKKFLGVPGLIMELIVTAAYRDPTQPSREFGVLMGSDKNHSPYDYVTINNRKVVQQTNTFGGFSFEDFNGTMIAAMNRSKRGIKETETPIEKIIYM